MCIDIGNVNDGVVCGRVCATYKGGSALGTSSMAVAETNVDSDIGRAWLDSGVLEWGRVGRWGRCDTCSVVYLAEHSEVWDGR